MWLERDIPLGTTRAGKSCVCQGQLQPALSPCLQLTLWLVSTRKSLLTHSMKESLPPAPQARTRKNFHAGIALSCSPPTSRAHTTGESNTPAFYRAKGFSLCLPLPTAMEHIPDPASRVQGMQTPSPALPTPLFMAAPSLAAQACSKAILLTICFMFSLYTVVPLHSCHRNMSLLIHLKGKKTTKPSEEPPRLLPVPHVEAEGRRSH